MKHWRTTISLLLLLTCGALLSLSCDRSGNKGAGKVVVVCSGDTAGWITPCGCAVNQSGGLPRRGTRLKTLRQQAPVLYIDAGGASAGASEYDLLKFRAILTGEAAMGLTAHNLGASEAMFGPEAIRDVIVATKVPVISANLTDANGKAVAPPLILADANGAEVAIVGVISRQFADPRWTVREPRSSALEALQSVKGQYVSAILLAYAPEDELQELARALPEFDAIIGGPTGQSIPPRRIGSVLLTSATNKGKFLAELIADTSRPNAWSWSATITELSSQVADDPTQKQNMERYLADLKTRKFQPEQTAFVPQLAAKWPSDYRFANPETCGKCHIADADKCRIHKHTLAYNDLVDRKVDVDPYCVRCHTTAYGLPGGFRSAGDTPSMLDVTCQACHGPSQAHADQPKTRTPWLAKEQCRNCHDHENSPQFEYDGFWKRIQHGEAKAIIPAGQEIKQ